MNWIRLLWWILIDPKQLRRYENQFDEKAYFPIARWLFSALIFLPLLIPISAAIWSNDLVDYRTVLINRSPVLTSFGLILGWLMLVWLDITFNLNISSLPDWFAFAFIIVGIIVGFAFGFWGAILTGVASLVIISNMKNALVTRKSNWKTKLIFALILLFHAFLIWIYYFGG